MRRRKGYTLPIMAKVYQWDGKKMRPLAKYRTHKGLEEKLSLYAQVDPEAQIYVERRGEWFKVKFDQRHNDKGELVEFGWELKESDGVAKNA